MGLNLHYHWSGSHHNSALNMRSKHAVAILPRRPVSNIRKEDFVSNLLTFLVETFESPPGPASTYLDQKAGFFDTLEQISAEQASKPVAQGATSIAAQVEHIRFYIDVVEQFMNGRTQKVHWKDSWQVKEVTPEAWSILKRDFRATYESATERFKTIDAWGDDEVGDSMAVVIHTAYHLGAIRQMVRVLADTRV